MLFSDHRPSGRPLVLRFEFAVGHAATIARAEDLSTPEDGKPEAGLPAIGSAKAGGRRPEDGRTRECENARQERQGEEENTQSQEGQLGADWRQKPEEESPIWS